MSSNGIVVSSGDLTGLSNQGQPGNRSQCSKGIPFYYWSNFQVAPWFDDSDKSPDEAAIPLLDIPRKNKIRNRSNYLDKMI